jgi:hypothetical protein
MRQLVAERQLVAVKQLVIAKTLIAILFFCYTLQATSSPASQVTLASWTTVTTCTDSTPTGTNGCPNVASYRVKTGTAPGVYTVSTDVTGTTLYPFAANTATLPRGYICEIVVAVGDDGNEGNPSNEICVWKLGNGVFSDNATRPTPKKPGNPR